MVPVGLEERRWWWLVVLSKRRLAVDYAETLLNGGLQSRPFVRIHGQALRQCGNIASPTLTLCRENLLS